MGLMDILQQYVSSTTPSDRVHEHFDAVVRDAPKDVVADGIAQAMRSQQTPPFADIVRQLFERSDPQQKAGVLNQLAAAVGPSVMSTLSSVLGAQGAGTALSPSQAASVTPSQVQQIANDAEKRDPGIIDRLGGFYAQHPDLVKQLGSVALAVALGHIANRTR